MITKGTLGLGCHSGQNGCYTFYDNIKITKYIPVLPAVSLGKFVVNPVFKTADIHAPNLIQRLSTTEKPRLNHLKSFISRQF
jgi:hypothetical protein